MHISSTCLAKTVEIHPSDAFPLNLYPTGLYGLGV
jgi:hypothetical protein